MGGTQEEGRMSPVEYCQAQISEIVSQLKTPITTDFRAEAQALVADLVEWYGRYRDLEPVAQVDWRAVA